MKVSVTIIALACMGLMFANQSVADLDPATIEGLWLFNDGTGKVAKDTSMESAWMDCRKKKRLYYSSESGDGQCRFPDLQWRLLE